MKILMIHHCDSLGGAGVSLKYYIDAASKLGSVTVCLPRENTEIHSWLKKNTDAEFAFLDCDIGMISSYSGGPKIYSRTFVRNLLRIRKSKKALLDILKSNEYDLVIVNSMVLSWTGRFISKLNIPVLCCVRETKPDCLGFFIIRHQLNRYFDAVTYISENDVKQMKLKVPKQYVVRDCVDADDYKKIPRDKACSVYGLNADSFNVLFLGGDNQLKGYGTAISAMQYLKDYNINLIVAGECKDENKCINDRIKYIGQSDDMPSLYSTSDVLIFPSSSPHQARPVFEAGFIGLPVIISDFPETAENVRDGYNGLTFTPNDAEQLALKIETLLNDNSLRQRLGENNRLNSMSKHDFKVCTQTVTEAIKAVIV